MSTLAAPARLPIATGRGSRVHAALTQLVPDGPDVVRVDLRRTDAEDDATPATEIPRAEADGDVIAAGARLAADAGVPLVLVLDALGIDPSGGIHGVASWGRAARALSDASGCVPLLAVLDGPVLGPPALLLGLVDWVIATDRGIAHVARADAILRTTGVRLDEARLGGVGILAESGVVADNATDLANALATVADLCDLLPPNNREPATVRRGDDPADRRVTNLTTLVPEDPRRSYDVRDVIGSIVDNGDFLEYGRYFGVAVTVGIARIDGRSVGVIANQPACLAGAIDIEASQKAARFVRLCDAFDLPLVTLVDTPGFRPGRDQEWRGMIRHGAQLAFAYAEATVPRIAVITRKAYGGAYIVMDAKTMGNDYCVAWPNAEVAVMGASGAVAILHRDALAHLEPSERAEVTTQLLADYEATYLTPRLALERGLIDEVIDPADTRAVIAGALSALVNRTWYSRPRRHSNTPL